MLPVIYQSGYLTIKDFDEESRLYTLDFPNREVKDGFLEVLLNKFVTVPNDDLGLAIANLSKALEIHHLMFRMTGYNVVSELQNVNGRSNVIVTTKYCIYIFELKMDKGVDFKTAAKTALFQIDANGYSNRFAVIGKQIYKIGVVFSSQGKGLVGWKIKNMQ